MEPSDLDKLIAEIGVQPGLRPVTPEESRAERAFVPELSPAEQAEQDARTEKMWAARWGPQSPGYEERIKRLQLHRAAQRQAPQEKKRMGRTPAQTAAMHAKEAAERKLLPKKKRAPNGASPL